MHRQVCTRIRVRVWGPSRPLLLSQIVPTAASGWAAILVGDATRLAIPSAAPAFVVTARCDDKQIRSASIASRLYPTEFRRHS